MTERFSNPVPQFSNNSGDPLLSGVMDFFENGSEVIRKDTFSDANLKIKNPNPLPLTADGRMKNCFYNGTARAVLRDDTGQMWAKDGVGSFGSGSSFDDWSSIIEYEDEALVTGSDGKYYRSLQDVNLGNDPISAPSFWEHFDFIQIWNEFVTYVLGAVVQSSDGFIYRSLQADNLNNEPTGFDAFWGSPLAIINPFDQSLNTTDSPTFVTVNTTEDLIAARIVKPGRFTTVGRPSAVTMGEGAVIYDTDLEELQVSDGADWLNAGDGVQLGLKVAMSSYFDGAPFSGSVIARQVASQEILFPQDLAGSKAFFETAPTAQADFTINKNGTPVGSFSFAISAQTATFVAASPIQLVAGDRLSIVSDAATDGEGLSVALQTDQIRGAVLSAYAADFYADVGVADAYDLTPTGQTAAPDALSEGLSASFNASNTNTGASTVDVDGLGVVPLTINGFALLAGQVVEDQLVEMRYSVSGAYFYITNFTNTPTIIATTDLSDVSVTPSTQGQFLRKGAGSEYDPTDLNTTALDDVSAAAPDDEDVLMYDTGTSKYVPTPLPVVPVVEAWPVGSIYISSLATNPAVTFGYGTWVAISEGRNLIGVGTGAGQTIAEGEEGGAKEKTLAANNIPELTDTIPMREDGGNTASFPERGSGTSSGSFTITVGNSSPDPVDIRNPYLGKYIWERTA